MVEIIHLWNAPVQVARPNTLCQLFLLGDLAVALQPDGVGKVLMLKVTTEVPIGEGGVTSVKSFQGTVTIVGNDPLKHRQPIVGTVGVARREMPVGIDCILAIAVLQS